MSLIEKAIKDVFPQNYFFFILVSMQVKEKGINGQLYRKIYLSIKEQFLISYFIRQIRFIEVIKEL